VRLTGDDDDRCVSISLLPATLVAIFPADADGVARATSVARDVGNCASGA